MSCKIPISQVDGYCLACISFQYGDVLVSECARALLAVHNVEIDVQNKLGDTPLHNAAWKGHAEVVALLLEKGIIWHLVMWLYCSRN